jgi:hypothetical protein
LALIGADLEARARDDAGGRCAGSSIASASGPMGMWDSFRFANDRSTWVVLQAQVFSPRHMLVPVSIQWEYFSWPGLDGTWWNPNTWWQPAKGGRQIQVPGWEEEGFQIRSCKRVFSGGRGLDGMRRFWRVTVTTPGDQSGLEVLQLLDADIPFVAVSANELLEVLPAKEQLSDPSTIIAMSGQQGLADKSAQDWADYIPVGIPGTDKTARDLVALIPFSGTSAKELLELLPTDIVLSGLPAADLIHLLDEHGVEITRQTAPAVLELITSDEYKIGRKYFWLGES